MGIKDLLQDFGNIAPRVKKKRGRWKPPPKSARWSDLYSTCKGATLTSVDAAREAIGVIERGETLHVISHGNWAMEHPVAHISEQFGPVDIWMATWAVNDDAVLRIVEVMRQGFVRNLRVIVDERMKVHRPAALDVLQVAVGDGNLGIMACHAKVYAIRQVDGDKCCAMVSSANFTQNPRPEATVMQADMRAVEFYATWIDGELDEGRARPYHHSGKLREELITEIGG